MKNQQTILCDVAACKHHCKSGNCCKLSQITVTPCDDCQTAHYCKDYINKVTGSKDVEQLSYICAHGKNTILCKTAAR